MRKKLVWANALVNASVQKGDLRMSFEELHTIDPTIYNFKEQFGINLIAVRLMKIFTLLM